MSTNLGWPSEPDPGPEHRRLGWLARMLGVSRETPAVQGVSTPEGDSAESARVQAVAGADIETRSGDAPGPPSSDPVHPSTPVERGPMGEPDGEPDGLADADRETDADSDTASDPGSDPLRAAETGRGASTAEPLAVDEVPSSLGTDVDDVDDGDDEAGVTVIDGDRSNGDGDDNDPDDGDHGDHGDHGSSGTGEFGTDASGSAPSSEPASPAAESLQDPPAVAAVPVDNAVDDGAEHRPTEQESALSRPGDNLVDDDEALSRLEADHADREALAAALPTPGTDTPLARELADNARRRIQLTGRQFPKPVSQRVLTVANQKGGVGKTTTTVNVAAALAQSGLTILVIDLDPQGNASTALGIDHHAEVPSIYDVLVDGTPLLDVVQPCTTIEKLFCAPATIDLAGAEIELVSLVARESRLQKAIAAAAETGHEFDYILIDCPPSLGLLTVNAMVAASEVFIPIQCEYYALEGLSQLLKNIDLVKRHLNPTLHVSTILLTMYDGRTRLSAQVADEVREHFPEEVLRTTVPRSVRVSEAPSFGETVMTYDPASSGALAYLEAAGEIADRGAAGRT
jgi:chromosome partitioning protein